MNGHKFNKSIFRAYDIRGIVADTLSVKDAYYIGYNFAKKIRDKFKSVNIVIGYDGRLSSPILEKSLIQGLFDNGANVIRIGLCASPMLYFASIRLRAEGAIMITGSHNPSNYNGFKILTKEGSYYGKELLSLMKTKTMPLMHGKIHYFDISNSYISNLVNAISFKKNNLKVVWDPGNGSTGDIIKKLIKHIPGEHILINSDVDGTFPSHHPDPTEEKNLVEIKKTIKKNHADIGIAFDGDGDRIGVLDSKANFISGDKLLLLFAMDVLKKKPKSKIIADVKASNLIFKTISSLGGTAIMSKTGHSLIKTKMKETKALLAGEMSGHIFFADEYYGFDDAIYASIRLLNIMSQGFNIKGFLEKFKNLYSTPEIKVFCEDSYKFKVIDEIIKITSKKYRDVSYIDGIRVNLSYGWWLIRASNTQPAIIVRCEANSKKSLITLIKEVDLILLKFDLKLNY
jgi:phosphomannomutase